ncbi:MAG: hypothetical protein ABEJ65_02185 [bacterium]
MGDSEEGEETEQQNPRESAGEVNEESTGNNGSQPSDNKLDGYRESPHKWDYTPGDTAAIVVNGFLEGYDLYFIALIKFEPEQHEESLEEIVTLASPNSTSLDSIDLEQPPDQLREELLDTRIEAKSTSTGMDDHVVYDKLRQYITSYGHLEDISEYLRMESVEASEAYLEEQFKEEVFGGTDLDLDVRVLKWTSRKARPSGSEAESESSMDVQETFGLEKASDNPLLTVTPKIRPFLGSEFGTLQPGDLFEVRVVGESAMQLSEEYMDESASKENPYSRALEAKLVALEQGTTPQELKFLVDMGDDIYGVGSVTRDARVLSNEQLIRASEPPIFYGLRILLVICSVLFFGTLIMFVFIL